LLLILTGVIGGLLSFGLLGLFLGPVVLASPIRCYSTGFTIKRLVLRLLVACFGEIERCSSAG